MAWIIHKDLIADPQAKPGTNFNAVGVMGTRGFNGKDTSKLTYKFRMLDDDGEAQYSRRMPNN